ncbi:MAG: MFS transporter [Pseudomonadota bacterium]
MTSSDSPSNERFGWYVVFVLCVCGIVASVDRQIINLLVEDIRGDLDISDTRISLLQGFAFAVFYALVAVPLGRLADSVNRRRLITIGIVAWTLAAIGCGLAESYWQLFAARMAVGIGEAVLTPAGFSLLADLFKARRLALPISVFTSSSFFGSGIALMFGGFIIGVLAGLDQVALPLLGEMEIWQAAFILAALPGLPIALWFYLSVREPPRVATAQAQIDATAYRQGFGQAVKFCADNRRLFVAVFIGLSCLAAAQFALGAWIPTYFIRTHGWTPSEIGNAQGLLFMVGGTAGVVTGGWLTGKLFKRGWHDANLRTASFCGWLAIPWIIGAMLVEDGTTAVALLAPAMFFGTMPFGAGAAIIPTVAPPQFRAQLTAVYLLVANLVGQSGGPWLVALLSDQFFDGPQAIGQSLAITVPVLLAAGALLTMVGWRPLAERLRDA